MRKFKFEKLIRDDIAETILKHGGKVDYRILSDDEYIDELEKKLVEEGEELSGAKHEDLKEEIADIQEIIDNLLEALKSSREELDKIKLEKIKEKGSFKKRMFVHTVELPDNHEWMDYYVKKYPEIKD